MTTAISPADALAERLFGATLGALELFSVYLGAELGLYRALIRNGPQTADGLARATGIATTGVPGAGPLGPAPDRATTQRQGAPP